MNSRRGNTRTTIHVRAQLYYYLRMHTVHINTHTNTLRVSSERAGKFDRQSNAATVVARESGVLCGSRIADSGLDKMGGHATHSNPFLDNQTQATSNQLNSAGLRSAYTEFMGARPLERTIVITGTHYVFQQRYIGYGHNAARHTTYYIMMRTHVSTLMHGKQANANTHSQNIHLACPTAPSMRND